MFDLTMVPDAIDKTRDISVHNIYSLNYFVLIERWPICLMEFLDYFMVF
jgi:hypothetical protein